MTARQLMLFAAAGSAALLAGAFVFQAIGYPPCSMCLWQRWPHAVAILIGCAAALVPARQVAWTGAVATAVTGGIGIYHTGVERDWWEGPTSCTGGEGLGGLSGADLLSTDAPMLVMCDQVSWSFLSLSMASWNAVFSFALCAVWLIAASKAGAKSPTA